jgi:hypothetical protein
MLERVRDALYRAITAPTGDSLPPVRIPKELARRLNATLGRPIAPLGELAKRAKARARLAELRSVKDAVAAPTKLAAPVVVYFEKDSNVRELTRIEELLGAKGYAYKRLDVAGDQATIDFVMREAGCKRDDLPVVFVAAKVIGTLDAVVRADVSGELQRAILG